MLEIGMKGKQEVSSRRNKFCQDNGKRYAGCICDSGNDRIDGKDCMDKRCRRTG